MRSFLIAALLLVITSVATTCKEQNAPVLAEPALVTATGTIQVQGITTYMYGSHVLWPAAGGVGYALRSSRLNLDQYVGRTVTVSGTLVPDYPVDGGPDFLEVTAVR